MPISGLIHEINRHSTLGKVVVTELVMLSHIHTTNRLWKQPLSNVEASRKRMLISNPSHLAEAKEKISSRLIGNKYASGHKVENPLRLGDQNRGKTWIIDKNTGKRIWISR